jgi:hypothetical protein
MAGDIRADMAGSGTDKQTSANYRKGGQHKGGQQSPKNNKKMTVTSVILQTNHF